MRKLKPGAVEDPRRKKDTDIYEDVICDKCGKSCLDSEAMNFEYASIEACWGFCTRKDAEHHTAELCEDCYDAIGLKPKVRSHFDDLKAGDKS